MSRIYFHSPDQDSEVRESERAHFGCLCQDLLMAAIGSVFDYDGEPHWTRRLFPADHYMRTIKTAAYERSLSSALSGCGGTLALPETTDAFTVALNTALVMGNDAIRLAARIHGQCEIHCWAAGKDREWLAGIIEKGRESNIFRSKQNWEEVLEHLRISSIDPVVLSYSVCDQFPNKGVAGWKDDNDGDDWYALSQEERWARAFTELQKEDGLQLTPERWEWPNFFFGPKITGFDLQALVEQEAVNK